jgi:hypothetical protein
MFERVGLFKEFPPLRLNTNSRAQHPVHVLYNAVAPSTCSSTLSEVVSKFNSESFICEAIVFAFFVAGFVVLDEGRALLDDDRVTGLDTEAALPSSNP